MTLKINNINKLQVKTISVVGVTGGAGSGKTTFCKFLSKKGFYHLDADFLSRQVVKPGSKGLKKVIDEFGAKFLNKNGQLDRVKLGKYVFEDNNRKKKLEEILHPLITQEFLFYKQQYEFLIYEATLLLEAGHERYVDLVVTVSSPLIKRIERVSNRPFMDETKANVLIQSQHSDEWREAKSDIIIINDRGLDDLNKDAIELLKLIKWI